jgi:hypothetical protein
LGRSSSSNSARRGDAEPPDQAFVVELPQQLTDRRVEFGQTVEAAVAQAAEQPSLDAPVREKRPKGACVRWGSHLEG